tara:strand:+ start:675 stop:1334 length:660 start_codon:yes stop_codon:yes gene_type:complete
MIKYFWEKIVGHFKGVGGNAQLLKRLNNTIDNLKNENLKKNLKKISKSKIDILKTPEEHRAKFIDALKHTEESLVILSNWKSNYVLNDEFENSLRSCLTQGITVHIGYIDSQINSPNLEFETEENAKKKIKSLQKWCFKELGQGCRLQVIYESKPTEILIVDDKYIINGDCEQENISWIFYDKNFVTSERNAIIGNLDGPLELTRRGLLRSVFPKSFNE